jgi:hypothetical protein
MLENCIIQKILSLFFLHKVVVFCSLGKQSIFLRIQHLYTSVISVKAAKVTPLYSNVIARPIRVWSGRFGHSLLDYIIRHSLEVMIIFNTRNSDQYL